MKHNILYGNEYHMTSSIALILVSSLMVVIAIYALVWAARRGHFKNLQKVAVDILDEER